MLGFTPGRFCNTSTKVLLEPLMLDELGWGRLDALTAGG